MGNYEDYLAHEDIIYGNSFVLESSLGPKLGRNEDLCYLLNVDGGWTLIKKILKKVNFEMHKNCTSQHLKNCKKSTQKIKRN